MFERFTKKAIKAVMLAQEEARRLGHDSLGTDHILLGLIAEGTDVASKVLRFMGVNLKTARIEVTKITGQKSGSVTQEIPFTPRCQEVLALSLAEAEQLGHNAIGTEHLLLGLLRIEEGVAITVLENLRVDLSQVRTQVLRVLEERAMASFERQNEQQKTVRDYADLIERAAQADYRRLPSSHPIDYSELVHIGAIAVHVLLTSNPGREFSDSYLSTAVRWAIRNELRCRYEWYRHRYPRQQTTNDEGYDDLIDKQRVREVIYQTIFDISKNAENPRYNTVTPEEISERNEIQELARAIRKVMPEKLPAGERRIVESLLDEELDRRTIGEKFKLSNNQISKMVQLGLDKIREALQKEGFVGDES